MLEEKNRSTLQRALRQLPEHEPEASVWESISQELKEAEREAGLRQSLPHLSTYTPPDLVWENIVSELESEEEKQEAKIRPLFPRTALTAAATIALLLAGLAWLLLPDSNNTRVTIIKREVRLPDTQLVRDWDKDEPAFETVRTQFVEHPLLRSHPKMQRLNHELEELNAAKAEIETVMDSYGRDADLINRIGQIERERSDVLKRMVALN